MYFTKANLMSIIEMMDKNDKFEVESEWVGDIYIDKKNGKDIMLDIDEEGNIYRMA